MPQNPTPPRRRSTRTPHTTTPHFNDVVAPKTPTPPQRQRQHKPTPRWGQRIARATLLTLLTLGIIGAGTFAYLYYTIDIPEADEIALAQTTTVYYSDATTPMGTYSPVNRTIIDPNTIPTYVGQAIVASEDRSFYTNSGIDLKGIARALYTNITSGTRQGGSTLTQQYVERYYLGETTDYAGKVKEAILALKINREQSKEHILGNYMNTIYFGRGAYGIEAAAKLYYGKKASELTLSEGALLAGIIPAPSAWDPALNPEQAQQRWQRVLDLMVEDGWISAAQAQEQTFPTTQPLNENGNQDFAGPQGYLLQHVRQELQTTANFTDEYIENGGLKIISTIDKNQFDAITQAANTMNTIDGWDNEHMHVAISAINPENGEITAEYGGSDYQKRQQNAATQDIAPAASTFKPFTLLAHIRNGGTIWDTYNGASPQYYEGLSEPIENDGGYSYGNVNLVRATEYSINTAFVKLNEEVGPYATQQAAIDAGIPADTVGLDDTLLNTLGIAAPHNIDLARAYATLAAGGQRTTPHIVRQVNDSADNIIYKAVINPERVFSEEEVSSILPALEAVTGANGTASALTQLGLTTAGKTGTASEQKAAQFVGFTPQLSVAVSMYQSDDEGNSVPLTNIGGLGQFHGGDWPTQVWVEFMSQISDTMPNTDFPWRVYIQPPVAPQPQEPQSTPEQQNTTPTPTPAPTQNQTTPSTDAPTTGNENGTQTPPETQNQGGQTPAPTPQPPTPTPPPQTTNNGNGAPSQN